jgi:hypothetical protein
MKPNLSAFSRIDIAEQSNQVVQLKQEVSIPTTRGVASCCPIANLPLGYTDNRGYVSAT